MAEITPTATATATATRTATGYAVPKPEPLSAASMAATIEEVDEDAFLSNSELLAREEVLKRRSRRLKQLARVYKDHYWSLMEELKSKYREYYWEYGKSPYQEDESVPETDAGKNGDDYGLGLEFSNDSSRCAVHGCKSKAMALTKFCHTHILSDSKQKLYMGCNYVIKSSQAGPILCGKPILKSTVPSLCTTHFQKAEKHVARALKKAGLNSTSTNKIAPKFHVIIAEYIRQIQTRRISTRKTMAENPEIKEEDISI